MPTTAPDPLIEDVLTIGEREIGASKMLRLFARVALNSVPAAALNALDNQAPFEQALGEEARAIIWQGLWEGLAELRPSAFSAVREQPPLLPSGPLPLAYLYARMREPQYLQTFVPTTEEAALLNRARAALATLCEEGLPNLRIPGTPVIFDERSLALRSVNLLDRGEAYSLCEESMTRRVVLLDGRVLARERARGAAGASAISALVLHEEIHSAIAIAGGLQGALTDEMLSALNEGTTSLLELAAFVAAAGGDLGDVERAIDTHPYKRQAGALYRAARPESLSDLCESIAKLATGAIRDRTREAAFLHLDAFSGQQARGHWQTALSF